MYEIKIKIHEEADLYNDFDPDQVQLKDEVVSYITRKYQEKERTDQYCMHIISDVPVDEERVRSNFRKYVEEEVGIINRIQHRSTMKQVLMFIIGIAFITTWVLMSSKTGTIVLEVLSIIGSFAVWEAANVWIVEKPTMRLQQIRLKKMMDTEVRFTVMDTNINTSDMGSFRAPRTSVESRPSGSISLR